MSINESVQDVGILSNLGRVQQAVVRPMADHNRDTMQRRRIGIGIERTTEPMPMPMPMGGRVWNHDGHLAAGFSLFKPSGVGGCVRMRPSCWNHGVGAGWGDGGRD
jgi:hypothetical protein